MKIVVDRDLCMGNGVCEGIHPAAFEVGDDGIVFTHDENIRADDRTLLTRAVANCPTRALRIVDAR